MLKTALTIAGHSLIHWMATLRHAGLKIATVASVWRVGSCTRALQSLATGQT